jgi:hypothetical protein
MLIDYYFVALSGVPDLPGSAYYRENEKDGRDRQIDQRVKQ